MPAVPSEDCARSSPDPAGESTIAVSRPTDTAPSFDGAEFVSLLPHDARATTRSMSALAPRDPATFEKLLALMPSTSLGRVPPAEHLPAPNGRLRPNLIPVHCRPPIGSLYSTNRFGDAYRLLLLHIRFEPERYASLLPEQDMAGEAVSGSTPVTRTSVHAHPR